ncbi:MAG: ComEA family DNA-binding protein [Patescibacteria group bacterium]|nr:ComEA family DNA-binding protein [Patescibacteria group bacterium]MCL5095261.1 ComEA family DNA-binding protein [Patescibacteria group bacterium]
MTDKETEFTDPEAEERIINTSKIYEFIAFYKIPLVFALLAVFLLVGAVLLWQSNKESARVIFTRENEANLGASVSAQIKVDVEGAIVSPGVYELVSGSRIQDLLIRAGGLSGEADREWISQNLNLAAKLIDGGKVYVPKMGERKTGEAILGYEDIANKININNASSSDLDKLSGVGPVTAQKIIDGRPYQAIEDLLSRKIINKSTFEKIKDKISVY